MLAIVMASDSLYHSRQAPAERDIRQEVLAQGLVREISGRTDLNPCRRSDRESGKALDARHALPKNTLNFDWATANCGRSLVAKSSPHCLTNRPRVYLAFGAAGMAGFENSAASNFAFITTLSIIAFSGGTGVSLNPRAVLVTGRTLVSRTNGISRPFTFR